MATKKSSSKTAASMAARASALAPAPASAMMRIIWPQVALRMAAKQVAAHLDAGATVDQLVDEFVIRQLLREVLVDFLSTAFVNKKESMYPDKSRRLDLLIGLPTQLAHLAVEIKSDPNNIAGVRSDWEKILAVDAPYKMVIFSGIASGPEYAALTKSFRKKNHKLSDGSFAHEVTRQKMSFDDPGIAKRVSFVWMWAIGPNGLPSVEFQIVAASPAFKT